MSNLSNQKQLFCFINVFSVKQTFLLPIYKDMNRETFYTQKLDQNHLICDFEEVDIDYFKSISIFYYIDTKTTYDIGSESVYAIDYNNGYVFGSRQSIITFYRNNLFLFDDSDFVQYMSDFIAENSDVLMHSNYHLMRKNKAVYFGFQKEIKKYDIISAIRLFEKKRLVPGILCAGKSHLTDKLMVAPSKRKTVEIAVAKRENAGIAKFGKVDAETASIMLNTRATGTDKLSITKKANAGMVAPKRTKDVMVAGRANNDIVKAVISTRRANGKIRGMAVSQNICAGGRRNLKGISRKGKYKK